MFIYLSSFSSCFYFWTTWSYERYMGTFHKSTYCMGSHCGLFIAIISLEKQAYPAQSLPDKQWCHCHCCGEETYGDVAKAIAVEGWRTSIQLLWRGLEDSDPSHSVHCSSRIILDSSQSHAAHSGRTWSLLEYVDDLHSFITNWLSLSRRDR